MTLPWPASAPALALAPVDVIEVRGPRHPWGGPLDVDGLAVASVLAAARAARALSQRRGRPRVIAVDSGDVVAAFDSFRHGGERHRPPRRPARHPGQ
ncbi:MAG: hypothetical protein ACYC1Z_05185 [Georgenia sp.]